MSGAVWWQWVGLLAWAVVPVPSMLLGMMSLNMLAIAVLGVVWFLWPAVGVFVYIATWVNLVGYRVLFGGKMRVAFPMTVNNQNGASAWLLNLGVLGAIRIGFAGDSLGIVLGVAGAAVLFFSQRPLFQPVQ